MAKIESMNIQSFFIARNQNSSWSNKVEVVVNGFFGIVIGVPNEIGASKNRNELLKLCDSQFVIFADDDMVFRDHSILNIEKFLNNNKCDGIKFLVELPNTVGRNAPKNKIIKSKKVRYLQCTDVGPWSFCFSRNFLIENRMVFFEKIGPGTKEIKAGEDTLFIKDLFKKGARILPYNDIVASIAQTESTWFTGFNENQLLTEGGIYYLLYKPFHFLFYIRHYLRFHKQYKYSFFRSLKIMNNGKRKAKSLLNSI